MNQRKGLFDLTPHPRILPMLGEIHLPQWKCLAEFIDNSVDSFIAAERAETPIKHPRIDISVPTGVGHDSQISVKDNGPGMDASTLERAARAGWTSNDPINNLGLFGMGFNIATARLGTKTTIWSTRADMPDWIGLTIDFAKLRANQSYESPVLTRPKPVSGASGTEVVVSALKSEQLTWFSKSYNRSNVSRQLGKIYSSMIGPARNPISFDLEVNGRRVRPKLHCVWGADGSPERLVETARHGPVNALQTFDFGLNSRPYCKQCWIWLDPDQSTCDSCGSTSEIVIRQRRVHGWLGIQRYLDRDEYGLDILRNGRKIEVGNKDIFDWLDETSDATECEYPIDDPRDRGRIVGEVHLDHCQIPYTKDRFVREDVAWREMVELIRGRTPLRPDIAASMGAGENTSPLFRLFQAFRRSTPKSRRAGGWDRILVVPDNNRAKAMVRMFDTGQSDYLTDGKWWDLIEEAESAVLVGEPEDDPDPDSTLGGPDEGGPGGGDDDPGDCEPETATDPGDEKDYKRTSLAALTQQYVHEATGQRFDVEAFAVESDDLIVRDSTCPWSMRRTTEGPWQFFVSTGAPVFRSITFTPLDALLTQISFLILDFERGQHESTADFGEILTALRARYATASMLVPSDMVAESANRISEIAGHIVGSESTRRIKEFVDSLSESQIENIQMGMAARGVQNAQSAFSDGRFLEYASPSVVKAFVELNPSAYFDGKFWDDEYETLDYGGESATNQARARTVAHYGGLLADAAWLAEQAPSDLADINRERLMRAFLAIELLAPSGNLGFDD